jgi:hypothetical protein
LKYYLKETAAVVLLGFGKVVGIALPILYQNIATQM